MSEQRLSLLKQEKGLVTQQMSEVREIITSIKLQLTKAKRENAITQEFKDSDWFNRAEIALKINGKEHLKLQDRLSKINQQIKKVNIELNAAKDNSFKAIAREMLDPTTFLEICREVDRRYEREVQSE